MNAFLDGLAVAWPWLWDTSLQVGILAAVLFLLDHLLGRRLAPRWRYLLWLVLVVRMLLPTLPPDPFDWSRQAWPRWSSPATAAGAPLPADDGGSVLPAPSQPGVPAVGAPRIPRVVRGEGDEGEELLAPVGDGGRDAAAEAAVIPSSSALPPIRSAPSRGWAPWATAAWLGGASLMLALLMRRERRFRQALRLARPVEQGSARELLDACCRETGVHRSVELWETELVAAPALSGWWRPRILLPSGASIAYRSDALRHVFLHELAHLRHGDVALNWVLAVLRSLHWCNPLVALAFRRLRSAQEMARDAEALRALRLPSPAPYARTVLDLATRPTRATALASIAGGFPRTNDIRRRIVMIQSHSRSTRSAVLGAGLVAVVAWTALTSGAAQEPSGDPGGAGMESIVVVRQDPVESWRTELATKLQLPVSLDARQAGLDDFIEELRRQTGLNFVLAPDVWEEWGGEEPVSVQVRDMSLEHLLRLVCQPLELDFAPVRGAICIAHQGQVPHSFGLRFYQVQELVAADDTEWEEERVEHLMEVIHEMTGLHDEWDREQARMEYWDGILLVNQTDVVHASVEELLNRILNRGAAPRPTAQAEAWRQALTEGLSRTVDVSFQQEEFGVAARILSEMTGLPIQMDPAWAEDCCLDLELTGVPVADVLEWIASFTELRVEIHDGVIWLQEQPLTELAFYEIGDLLPRDEDFDPREALQELLTNTVAPEAWEWEDSRLMFWDDLMLVEQTPEVQRQLESFLRALRSARKH